MDVEKKLASNLNGGKKRRGFRGIWRYLAVRVRTKQWKEGNRWIKEERGLGRWRTGRDDSGVMLRDIFSDVCDEVNDIRKLECVTGVSGTSHLKARRINSRFNFHPDICGNLKVYQLWSNKAHLVCIGYLTSFYYPICCSIQIFVGLGSYTAVHYS